MIFKSIPVYILKSAADPIEFDKLVLMNLLSTSTHREAYEAAVEQIAEHIEGFMPYDDYDSYRTTNRTGKENLPRKNKKRDVPCDIVKAMSHKTELNELYFTFYRQYKNGKRAFDMLMGYIERFVPEWKPYSSYESFRQTQNRKHTKNVSNKTTQRKRKAK